MNSAHEAEDSRYKQSVVQSEPVSQLLIPGDACQLMLPSLQGLSETGKQAQLTPASDALCTQVTKIIPSRTRCSFIGSSGEVRSNQVILHGQGTACLGADYGCRLQSSERAINSTGHWNEEQLHRLDVNVCSLGLEIFFRHTEVVVHTLFAIK